MQHEGCHQGPFIGMDGFFLGRWRFLEVTNLFGEVLVRSELMQLLEPE